MSEYCSECDIVYAPFVYRLGHPPFTQVRGVRFSYGVPSFRSQDVHGRTTACHAVRRGSLPLGTARIHKSCLKLIRKCTIYSQSIASIVDYVGAMKIISIEPVNMTLGVMFFVGRVI